MITTLSSLLLAAGGAQAYKFNRTRQVPGGLSPGAKIVISPGFGEDFLDSLGFSGA